MTDKETGLLARFYTDRVTGIVPFTDIERAARNREMLEQLRRKEVLGIGAEGIAKRQKRRRKKK